MPRENEGNYIAPTENLQRVERSEKCLCGGTISVPLDHTGETQPKAIEDAVMRHQRTAQHRVWSEHRERMGDW